jgi:myo-inositol catabolism protein IolC
VDVPLLRVLGGGRHMKTKWSNLGVPKPEWWKHLRPFNKRRFWKKVRRAFKKKFTP